MPILVRLPCSPTMNPARSVQIAFRKVMAETHGHDLDKWRRSILSKRPSKEYLEGFQMLDLDERALWDLLKQLMAYEPSRRLSAAGALRHRAFRTGLVGRLTGVLSNVGNVADQVRSLSLDLMWPNSARMLVGYF